MEAALIALMCALMLLRAHMVNAFLNALILSKYIALLVEAFAKLTALFAQINLASVVMKVAISAEIHAMVVY